jgi:hypothetical protein
MIISNSGKQSTVFLKTRRIVKSIVVNGAATSSGENSEQQVHWYLISVIQGSNEIRKSTDPCIIFMHMQPRACR